MTLGGRFTGHSPWAHGRGSCHICVAAKHGAYGVVFYILVQIKDSNRNNSIACSLIRGVHGSVRVGFLPNPDSTRMWRVNKKLTRNRPGDLVGFFGSGLVGFGLIRVGFGFITGDETWPDSARSGRNLTGSCDIWPKYSRIRRDRTEIWPDPSRSGRNLTGSFDIWPKSGWIRRDRTEIWPDPSRSGLDFVG